MDTKRTQLLSGWKQLTYAVRNRIGIDTRSLAAFRILLGLLIIGDVLSRSRNFSFYYTDDGVVTQGLAQWWTGDAFSIFYYTSNPRIIGLLFGLHALIALQLIVGYKTRIATVLSFLFVVSLDHHNPLVLSYADTLFRLLFFWAMFLPLGERWAVDAVHRDRDPRETFVGIAGLFALLQMILMYFRNGIHKYPSELWRTGEGTPLVFGIDEMTFLLGDTMRQFPTLLEVGGQLWFVMLLGSPLLVLLAGRWRLPLVALFMCGHLAFAITVRIGAFPYVALAGLLLFIPTVAWDDIKRLLASRISDANIDQRCRRIATQFPDYRLDSPRNKHRKADLYTITLGAVTVGIILTGGAIALASGGVIHDDALDDGDDQIEFTVAHTDGIKEIHRLAKYFNIDQPEWSIFAGPDPRTSDRYYVFAAKTESGEELDLYFERNLTYERPYQQLQRQHDTYRMRFYMNSIRTASGGNNAPDLFAEHLCEQWATEHETNITHLNMYSIRETITHETIDDPSKRDRSIQLQHKFTCGEEYTAEEFAPPEGEN